MREGDKEYGRKGKKGKKRKGRGRLVGGSAHSESVWCGMYVSERQGERRKGDREQLSD